MTDPSTVVTCRDPSKPDCPGHDPRKCTGHKDGGPCGNWRLKGTNVCRYHGGRAPQVQAKAEERVAEERVRRTLGRLTSQPVTNPLEDLLALAGKSKAWLGLLEGHVAELEELASVGGEGVESIRAVVVLFERSMEQCRKVLVDVARLDIDTRLTAITEAQIGLALHLVDAILRRRGIDPNSVEVRADKVAEIAALPGMARRSVEGVAA